MSSIFLSKKGFRFSIPIKVVVLTGLSYIVLWAVGFMLQSTGAVNFSDTLFGVEVRILYVAVEIILMAIAATFGTHYFLDKPLTKLTDVMARAEEGDFLIRAAVGSNDEIGELTRTFNRMLSKITDLTATKIQTDHDLMLAQEQLKFRKSIEEKNKIIQRTNGALEALVRDLSLIYEIGQEVNSVIDLDRLYANITETLRKYIQIDELAILVYDDKREELHVRAAFGFPDDNSILRTSFSKGEGITGLVAATGKKVYIRNTSLDSRFLNYKGERPVDESSFLSIPLVYKGEVLGVINFTRRGSGSFTIQDVRMMSLVAGQVALAISNANLYTRTRELSVRDELTGINNRRYFQQMLQMEWKRAARFKRHLSLIMVDVDHFKEYNDTYGHLQGDEVLKQIGDLLKRNLREVDTVARFGGEEFVLLLPDTDKRGAVAVAEKVRMLVEAHNFFASTKLKSRTITISAGVATYPDDITEMDDLIDRADIALYRAKENGRNRIECYAPISKDAEEITETTFVPAADQKPKTQLKKPDTLQ